MARAEVQKFGQVLPDEFADLLRTMRAADDPRLSAVLWTARRNGWTLVALARALDVTKEAIRWRVAHAGSFRSADLPDVPLPPRWPTPVPKPPRPQLEIPPDLATDLREMWQECRSVNGAASAEDPRRRTSEKLTAYLAALVEQGVPVKRLAKTLGISRLAITARLARHGYRKPCPSMADDIYTGRPPEHWRSATCPRGHPKRTSPGGQRYCPTCQSQRYYARKAEARHA